jgi:hypothetical protein
MAEISICPWRPRDGLDTAKIQFTPQTDPVFFHGRLNSDSEDEREEDNIDGGKYWAA